MATLTIRTDQDVERALSALTQDGTSRSDATRAAILKAERALRRARLRAEAEDYWNRVVQQGDRRPLDQHPEARAEFKRLLATREPLYAQATHVVDTSRLDVDEAAQAIAGVVTAAGAGKAARAH